MKEFVSNQKYWKSLEQLEADPEFQNYWQAEFSGASEEGQTNSVSRRKFLTLMGASFALAGLANCRRPVENIVPYVVPPEEAVPGVPIDYHTAMPFGNSAYGLTISSFDGRPIKIEGNPLHPSSLGATNAFLQSEILVLYDPDRSTSVLKEKKPDTWEHFVAFLQTLRDQLFINGGEGMAVISRSSSSPTLVRLQGLFKKSFPQSRWVVYDPVSDEHIYKGLKSATGKSLLPIYHFVKARVIAALDSDFLAMESENIRHARQFADGRRISSPEDVMNRLYVVEGALSLTGSMADHRLRLPNSRVATFAAALALTLNDLNFFVAGTEELDVAIKQEVDQKWLKALAHDLITNAGECLVITGRSQSIAVHALVLSINRTLGNIGKTVEYREATSDLLPDASELAKLKYDVDQKKVDTLIVLGGNPLYDASIVIDFSKIENTIHLSSYVDETSRQSTWHIPQTHFLEEWGDVSSIDGVLSITQPLIEPLYGGKSDVELLHLLATGQDIRGYDLVRETWKELLPKPEWESAWRRVLHDGIYEAAVTFVNPEILEEGVTNALKYYPAETALPSKERLDLVFKPSSHVYDGRYTNNGWLLENPDPITKLTWDNAALMSPLTAKELGLKNNDVVRIALGEKEALLPVWQVPGQADNTITVQFGFGRSVAGHVGNRVGVNVYPLRSTVNSFIELGAVIAKTRQRHELASTQDHGGMEGRPIVREATLDEFQHHPKFAKKMVEHPPLKSLWKEYTYDKGYQWGMIIDLNTCIGCGACTVACQSENNIPIVGKKQVLNGREMHWIRIDRYFTGDPNDPQLVHQPMACQQCEMAPCESVCPVSATVHDSEGLNLMVYNRCVGTRYCSNNCPFKVRRFNFFNYYKHVQEIEKLQKNPNVTVRSRGVMEKCTYCLQRIVQAKEKAKQEGRPLGDFQTACQQVCPTRSITFGNILDPDSAVAKLKQDPREYGVLSELNLKARTTYLAKIRNPNPELA
jgi:MoCo/4Fe-4S cofactor protein with predicted Tat translocation signal